MTAVQLIISSERASSAGCPCFAASYVVPASSYSSLSALTGLEVTVSTWASHLCLQSTQFHLTPEVFSEAQQFRSNRVQICFQYPISRKFYMYNFI